MTKPWTPLPAAWRKLACSTPGCVLLESSLPSDTEHHSLLFQSPLQILCAGSHDEVPSLFDAVEDALHRGFWVAGFLNYEAGAHFLELPEVSSGEPLACFAVYPAPQIFDHHLADQCEDRADVRPLQVAPMPLLTRQTYMETVQKTQGWIAAGETYQLNYTMQLQSPCPNSGHEVYETLRAQQPSSYAAVLSLLEGSTILSLSPELFFRVAPDGSITTKPMKGTMPRGETPQDDERLADTLRRDEKNRAEHVMIVDLLRNDFNRVCTTGSVRADGLFHVERYRTLHQMTSRVSGTLCPGTTWYRVFQALFPGGSITGAPKRHTAELIHQCERGPRGVYTGAIGYFAPDRSACFNVAIRTPVLRTTSSGERTLSLGVGGGIVADSNGASEYDEALLKSAFVQRSAEPWHLIETMRAEQGRIPLLDAHMERLAASAEALGFVFEQERTHEELHERKLHGRVRLQLERDGRVGVSVSSLPSWPHELHLCMSDRQTTAASPHLRHKTSFRPEYNRPVPAGFDDVLFCNTQYELTESSLATLLLHLDGRWYTPPLECGVLAGVMRAHLLQLAEVTERILTVADLQRSTAVALCNAVRGVGPVKSVQLVTGQVLCWTTLPTLPKKTAW